jgi:hypothetical protein
LTLFLDVLDILLMVVGMLAFPRVPTDVLALVCHFRERVAPPVAVLALASTSRGDLKAEEEPRRMGVEPITSNHRCNHVGILTSLPKELPVRGLKCFEYLRFVLMTL